MKVWLHLGNSVTGSAWLLGMLMDSCSWVQGNVYNAEAEMQSMIKGCTSSFAAVASIPPLTCHNERKMSNHRLVKRNGVCGYHEHDGQTCCLFVCRCTNCRKQQHSSKEHNISKRPTAICRQVEQRPDLDKKNTREIMSSTA